jgi:hypothetical protein
MTTSLLLQDPGLPDNRLLARLFEAGTLVLDERDAVHFASAGACELFGAEDEAALRLAWRDLASQLRIGEWPRTRDDAHSFCGRAEVDTACGTRAIRYEMHVADDAGSGHRMVLVRDRSRLLPSDRALLLAAQALANRHALTGLVHAAKGPLNNFNLTLALLAGGITRGDADRPRPDAGAKRARYVEVLQNEAVRLAACVDEIHALTLVHDGARETIDLSALSQDCARVLRHGATMREVALELDLPARTVHAVGDPALVRLALLSFAISLIELTSRGGRVGWQLTQEQRGGHAKIAMTTSEPSLPNAFASGLFRLSCTAESPFSAAIAARLVVEAQSGDVVVRDGRDSTAGILLALPASL